MPCCLIDVNNNDWNGSVIHRIAAVLQAWPESGIRFPTQHLESKPSAKDVWNWMI